MQRSRDPYLRQITQQTRSSPTVGVSKSPREVEGPLAGLVEVLGQLRARMVEGLEAELDRYSVSGWRRKAPVTGRWCIEREGLWHVPSWGFEHNYTELIYISWFPYVLHRPVP